MELTKHTYEKLVNLFGDKNEFEQRMKFGYNKLKEKNTEYDIAGLVYVLDSRSKGDEDNIYDTQQYILDNIKY